KRRPVTAHEAALAPSGGRAPPGRMRRRIRVPGDQDLERRTGGEATTRARPDDLAAAHRSGLEPGHARAPDPLLDDERKSVQLRSPSRNRRPPAPPRARTLRR